MALPTPDTFDLGSNCRLMVLPVDLRLLEAINGAIVSLTDPDVWEQHGAKTPEETAEFFNQFFITWHRTTAECPPE